MESGGWEQQDGLDLEATECLILIPEDSGVSGDTHILHYLMAVPMMGVLYL